MTFVLGVFIFFGLSGIAPATHYGIVNGWEKSLEEVALGWLILMGSLYITGYFGPVFLFFVFSASSNIVSFNKRLEV